MRVGSGKERGNFMERFKGKMIAMTKDGHIGVVANSTRPIQKVYRPISNQSDTQLPPLPYSRFNIYSPRIYIYIYI